MKTPKLNVRLLKRIVKHLQAEPKRYNQGEWGKHVTGEEAPACHTQGCIAGWAVFLSVSKKSWMRRIREMLETHVCPWQVSRYHGIPKKAKQLLGLTDDEACQLFRLNQRHITGKEGVKSAVRKIEALIRDREAFAVDVDTEY